ncbi:MAG: ComF family protein, partial [Chloroflexi bacterium]|nr:ComF family protein [Chloroflexota bacterium]
MEVPECRECHGRRFYFERAVAAGRYEGVLKEAVHALKYKNGKRLATRLSVYMTPVLGHMAFDVLTYVPMNRGKQSLRGYNQAQLLAIELGKLLGVHADSLLRRAG